MSFSWSYSKVDNAETCPRKHYEVDIARNWKDDRTVLQWGEQVHAVLATAAAEGVPLPPEMISYGRWIEELRRHQELGAEILVEQKYALTAELDPTGWMDDNVWYRGILDRGALYHRDGVGFLDDYKTGKKKHDHTQLMLMALCIFMFYPGIRRVRTRYIWLKDGTTTDKSYSRDDVAKLFSSLLLRVQLYKHMIDTKTFHPNPSGLCYRNCPVQTCEYHGKRVGRR